jgi:hypothetical protein
LVDRLAVVGAVRDHARDAALRLPEQGWRPDCVIRVAIRQHMRGDLAGAGINGEMQLAPVPACSTMLLGIPLALAKQLQPGAVEHEVNKVIMPREAGDRRTRDHAGTAWCGPGRTAQGRASAARTG